MVDEKKLNKRRRADRGNGIASSLSKSRPDRFRSSATFVVLEGIEKKNSRYDGSLGGSLELSSPKKFNKRLQLTWYKISGSIRFL